MNQSVPLTKFSSRTIHSLCWLSRRRVFLLVALATVCLALAPLARAVDPPPDGGYPGENTAEGTDALFSLIKGSIGLNTAIGFQALYSNTTGYENTAGGANALHNNTTGFANVANGDYALYSNTTGARNTAIGSAAVLANTTGGGNTATGDSALRDNTTGYGNTANGFVALTFNSTGSYNTAVGNGALAFNTTGNENTAVGDSALNQNTTGSGNIALGEVAGVKLTTGNNNIDIGNPGRAGESNTIRIGARKTHNNTFIAGISGRTVPGGVTVLIDTEGHLGTMTSSARYKEAIQPMDKASEAILALQPVTFRYKQELDPDGIPQFGLVAEQVAKVNPDLVARDEEGKAYTVRYEAVNAMLLNEFLKEHRKVEGLEATVSEQRQHFQSTIAQQQNEFRLTIAQQQKQIKALTRRLQKVSDKLEASKSNRRLVLNDE
jgi:uncharacterized coiled-coil protein SlyX